MFDCLNVRFPTFDYVPNTKVLRELDYIRLPNPIEVNRTIGVTRPCIWIELSLTEWMWYYKHYIDILKKKLIYFILERHPSTLTKMYVTFILHTQWEQQQQHLSAGPYKYFCRPFASKAFFWTILKNFEFAVYSKWRTQNLSKSLKTAFEVKGPRYTTGKVIQGLFHIDLYTYLAIYRYRWGER